ncbi:MAG: FeoB-associated Cys-rich membrane protein [Clostridia bacterium]|nr:FeoB-associated Cys-rich membrane protein [Clostridia bacterium]
MIENIVIVSVLIILFGSVIFYIVRKKKKGAKCIGCPYCESCGKKEKENCSK